MKLKREICITLLALCTAAGAQDFKYDIPFPGELRTTKDTTTLYFIGDVMMHSRQMEHDHTTFLADIAPEMLMADVCVANMEFTVAGPPYSGYPCFCVPEYYPEYVADCGADVFLMANNHILDKGPDGLSRTEQYYAGMHLRRDGGLQYTGTGWEPLFIHAGGHKIALINFTYGINGRKDARVNTMDKSKIKKMFDRAREENADFIIALPHWGVEYSLTHNAEQERWAHDLVEWGADAVIGSHPHVVQDTTHICGKPVIYSLGNAVSNMSATNTRLELAVTLRIVSDRNGSRMLEPELDFLWCTLPGMLTGSYATISIKKWASRRGDWLIDSDYLNMSQTLARVLRETGIDY